MLTAKIPTERICCTTTKQSKTATEQEKQELPDPTYTLKKEEGVNREEFRDYLTAGFVGTSTKVLLQENID